MLVATTNFLVPNATFVVELVAFLIVLGVLKRYVLPPLNERMEERQKAIRQALVDAEEAKKRSQAAEAEYRETINRARNEARAMVDEANRLGDRLRADLRQRGEEEYERIMSRASTDIAASARRAAEELRAQVADMVISVVEKVIGEGLDDQAHRQLIDRTIADIESQGSVEVNQ
ncbi:MAG TPA: F0F1 ATP synthase subunit B [Acidimicrobiales bacterium]|nr:F0F1 ATP synthase subunit B [Acidimicrobiales bacterium]